MVVANLGKPESVLHGLGVGLAVTATLAVASFSAHAQTVQPTVLDAWLSQPALSALPSPYQYIRGAGAVSEIEPRRDALIEEFDELDWRLERAGYPRERKAVGEWRERIANIESFRTPGSWGPASLLANPGKMPPFDRVQAIGGCQQPSWVELWDSDGVRRMASEDAQTLSMLLSRVDTDTGKTGRMIVVRPSGLQQSYGVQAWNFYDTTLTPGTRVVASLSLGGDAFAWIQKTMADVLAHTPSGIDCQEAALVKDDG